MKHSPSETDACCRMKNSRLLFVAVALTLCALCLVRAGQAQTIELKNLSLDNLGNTLQLHFGFTPDEFQEFDELLKDGVPLKLQCEATLLRVFTFWPDRLVSQKALSFELKANTLSQEYILQDLTAERSMKNKELEPLLRSNLSELVLNLGDWKSFVQGEKYALQFDVSLQRNDVPNWLKDTLFFWSGYILKKKKYRMIFTY